MLFSNLHTHTLYCDGKNTAEEMVLAAIAKGFHTLGFSGHAPISYDPTYCMSEEGLQIYIAEVNRLKEKYKSQISIFLGVETDLLEPFDRTGFDYVIGSVHAVYKNGNYSAVDNTKAELEACINRDFGGDGLAMVEAYYALVEQAIIQKPDILGHFDLVCKFNGDGSLFSETSTRYKVAAKKALTLAVENGLIIEVNTGGMARGYLDRPYPDIFFLKEACDMGAKILVASDCHNADMIDYGFKDTELLLKKIGYQAIYELTKDGFREVPLL